MKAWRDGVPYVQAAFDAGCRRFGSAEVGYLALAVDPHAQGTSGRWSILAQDAEVPGRSERYLRRWTVGEAIEVLAFFGFTVANTRNNPAIGALEMKVLPPVMRYPPSTFVASVPSGSINTTAGYVVTSKRARSSGSACSISIAVSSKT